MTVAINATKVRSWHGKSGGGNGLNKLMKLPALGIAAGHSLS